MLVWDFCLPSTVKESLSDCFWESTIVCFTQLVNDTLDYSEPLLWILSLGPAFFLEVTCRGFSTVTALELTQSLWAKGTTVSCPVTQTLEDQNGPTFFSVLQNSKAIQVETEVGIKA